MVSLLTEGVVAGVSGMFIEKQEQALVVLLSEVMAWKPSNAWRKDDVLLAAHNSGRFDGLALAVSNNEDAYTTPSLFPLYSG
jgi:hypothetical protein